MTICPSRGAFHQITVRKVHLMGKPLKKKKIETEISRHNLYGSYVFVVSLEN